MVEGTVRSRRAVLTASLGGLAGLIAHALGRPATVEAAGEVIHVGDLITTEVKTEIRNEVNTESVFRVSSDIGTAVHGLAKQGAAVFGSAVSGTGVTGMSSSGNGVFARSTGGHGVHAESQASTGISAFSGQGVGLFVYSLSTTQPALISNAGNDRAAIFGYSGFQADPPAPSKTGVYGLATQDSSATGVRGRSTVGIGVHAEADAAGTALKVTGKASFSRSGTVTVGAGKSSITKSLTGLSSTSLVFAVVRTGDSAAFVRRVRPTTGSFTVYLSKAVTTSTTVSWIAFG